MSTHALAWALSVIDRAQLALADVSLYDAAKRLLAEAPPPDPNPGGRHPHPDPWCRACVAHGITLAYLESGTEAGRSW